MIPPSDRSDAILDAALALAGRGVWPLSMADIATEAGASLAEVHAVVPRPGRLLACIVERLDRRVLADSGDTLPEGSGRDRLFDVLMRRFDGLQLARAGYIALLRQAPRDLPALLEAALAANASMRWMLEAARLPTAGVAGALRVKAVGAAYAVTLRDWIRDESGDLSRTMAALDAHLRRIERWL